MQVLRTAFHSELKEDYLQYSLSVIIGRAIPNAKDGLKPVQRRILYTMYKLKNFSNQPYKKSARIVGDTMGRLHPHGDIPIYDALVRMAQPFSMRYCLIDGQGNFGSVDNDPPAAMRYTEARLAKIAEEMLKDIEKQTVDMLPNFDNTTKEPIVLPTRIPNLLINGSSGIAVGIATNMPPHNLSEVCDAICYLLDHPNSSIEELMQFIKGPDFPTGGAIIGKNGIEEAYKTGKGKIILEAKYHFDQNELVIDEIPYTVSKADLIQRIVELTKQKNLDIGDIKDESDKKGIRVVIKLKKDADKDYILNQLLLFTPLRISFNIMNVCILENKPVVLNLKELLDVFIQHRKDVITRRSKFDLENAKKRLHLVEGFLFARERIDEVIKLIKEAQSSEEAKKNLISIGLDEPQAEALLELKLRSLTKLEIEALKNEKQELSKKISELEEILRSEEKLKEVIKNEILEIKKNFGDERKTEIIEKEIEINEEQAIKEEDVVIVLTDRDYIKRVPISVYRSQRRGGKGIRSEAEEAIPKRIAIANTKEKVFFFTNNGKAYYCEVYKIPEGSRYSEGRAIRNVVPIKENERIVDIVSENGKYFFFVTKKGIVKRTSIEHFKNLRKSGKIAISLKDDELVGVKACDEDSNIIIATRKGMAIRFLAKDVREMGRNAYGVRGIKLKADDTVVDFEVVKDEAILTVTRKGFGKLTQINEYRLQKRGGKGVRNIRINEKNGEVVKVVGIKEGEEVFLINSKGIAIRIPSDQIRKTRRVAIGVRLMHLNENEEIVDCKKVEIS
jgi:DNA gyrase subunit A